MIFDPKTDNFGLDEEFSKLLGRIDNIDQYYPQAGADLSLKIIGIDIKKRKDYAYGFY
jgi:hypothetical protein